jgi:hypothetical protein
LALFDKKRHFGCGCFVRGGPVAFCRSQSHFKAETTPPAPKKPEFSVNSRENAKIAKKSVISPAFAGTELWFISTARLVLALYG